MAPFGGRHEDEEEMLLIIPFTHADQTITHTKGVTLSAQGPQIFGSQSSSGLRVAYLGSVV